MAKISDLPKVAAPDGAETVVVLKDGEAKRVDLAPLVEAGAAPVLAEAGNLRDEAAEAADLAGRYANAATDADIPGAPAGARGAYYWTLVAQNLLASLQATATDNAAAVALLRQIATQTIGRPVAPIAGAATTYPVTMRDAALQAGAIETIPLYVRGAGPLQLTLYTVSGPLLTRVATYTANLTSAEAGTNVNLTPARFGVSSIPIAAGQVAQVYGPNVLAVTATVADGTGWSTTGGAGAATITNPVWSTSARVELGLNIKYTTQPVTAAAFNALQTSVAALSSLQATAADNAAAVGLLRQVAYQTIGRTVPPIDGTAVSQPGVLLRDQVPVDCELDSLPVFVKAATTFSLYRYALLAGVYTRVNTGYVATFTSAEVGTVVTLNAARFGVASLPFKAGEFIQLSGSGAWPVTAVAADGAGWSTSAGLGATTITNPVWSTGARLELGITFKYTTQPVTAVAFNALQATVSANALAVASLQAAVTSNAAAIAKLQKAMVQRIGRTGTPTAGTGVANAAGVLLRDATGQDCAFGKLLIKPAGSGAFKMTRYLPNGTTLNRLATYTATIDAAEVGTDVVLTPARFGQTAINLVAGEILQIPGTGFLPLTAGVAADGTGWSTTGGLAAASIANPAWSTAVRLEVAVEFNYTSQPVTADAVLDLQAKVAALAPAPDPTLWAASAEIPHFIIYGQSVSLSQTERVNNAAALDYALRYAGGVRSQDGGTDPATIHASLTGLREQSNAPNAESPASGMARMLRQLYAADGVDVSAWNRKWLFSAPGQGATAAAGLAPGSGPFTRLLNDISYGPAAAAAYGKPTIATQMICLEQGQEDYGNNTVPAAWAATIESIRAAAQAQARVTANQPDLVLPMILTQISSHLAYGRAYPGIALQQAALHDNPYYCIACPEYPLPPHTASPPHLAANGVEWMGAYWAVAHYNWIERGKKAAAMKPTKVVRMGNSLLATYPVARGRYLVKDDTIAGGLQTNLGYSLVDAAGNSVPISNARIVGRNQIAVDFASAWAAGWILRYGFADSSGGAVFGKGNIRDNAGDALIYAGSANLGNVPMHNWALHSETPVT